MDIARVTQDLIAEQNILDKIVTNAGEGMWLSATPAAGWTVADQIAHLAYFDRAAAMAITDPAAFSVSVADLMAVASSGDTTFDDATLGEMRTLAPSALLGRWRDARQQLRRAARTLNNESRVNWYGPSMGARSFLTARLMEVWAHGQDVVDTIGVERESLDRLRHIAQLGFITRQWSYQNRGLQAPTGEVRLSLVAPSGDVWEFGSEEAEENVTGPAVDFCLVVTQRRHVDDTALVATPVARDWLEIAQAFAGPPTDGPAARRVAP
jgi:uncharacterized protein (TIGR03084 family)